MIAPALLHFPTIVGDEASTLRRNAANAIGILYMHSAQSGTNRHMPPQMVNRGKRDAFRNYETHKEYFRGQQGKIASWILIHVGQGQNNSATANRNNHPIAGNDVLDQALVTARAATLALLSQKFPKSPEDDAIAELASILTMDFHWAREYAH